MAELTGPLGFLRGRTWVFWEGTELQTSRLVRVQGPGLPPSWASVLMEGAGVSTVSSLTVQAQLGRPECGGAPRHNC